MTDSDMTEDSVPDTDKAIGQTAEPGRTEPQDTTGEGRTYDPTLPRFLSVSRTPEGLEFALEVRLRFSIRHDRITSKTVPNEARDGLEMPEEMALNWARENGFIPADSRGNPRSIRSKTPLRWEREERNPKVKRLRVVARGY